ncbi:response regulator [Aurantimonas sp. 22II-16-19i]|uniref:response regulator transcription factor n=1 Tax=Aurantimonas sp. 22II-16-19i TaxID=1317114 RepID=UPI0009F7AC9A|nr:response regulator [Aurantimonas sp. 22II-16-19i]ORE90379.1 two component response regulator [Aurantimonas sp. 22II-16-19i]
MNFERGHRSAAERQTVFLVDDDRDVRLALEGLLRSVHLTVETFASVEAFLASGRVDAPGCLILDVRLAGLSGLAFQADLVESGSRMPIVFVSGHADVAMAVRAMKLGAADFLTKPLRPQELIDAIHSALATDRERRALEAAAKSQQSAFEALSPREREVLTLVASGLTNREAAARLGIIEATVKAHRGQIMKKLGVISFAALIRRAVEMGL